MTNKRRFDMTTEIDFEDQTVVVGVDFEVTSWIRYEAEDGRSWADVPETVNLLRVEVIDPDPPEGMVNGEDIRRMLSSKEHDTLVDHIAEAAVEHGSRGIKMQRIFSQSYLRNEDDDGRDWS